MTYVVSIGIMAYNEEKNIGLLLENLLLQRLTSFRILEIIIISSGSTDKTNKIVGKFCRNNKKIKLYVQRKRFGKASAVNLFLTRAKSPIVVTMSADLLLKSNTLEKLLSPLKDKQVGISGAHPVPVNDIRKFMGFAAHLLWNLHHQISLKSPKMGEMIAFRKIFKQIPYSSSVDEANIEPLIRGQGFKAVYAANAIIYNKGPEKLSEFIARRRHIYYGHLVTKHIYGYEVSTLNVPKILYHLLKSYKLSPRFFVYTPAVLILEAYGRLLGFLDFKFNRKSHTIWEMTASTKNLAGSK